MSTQLTIFWHCGFGHFSFRTSAGAPSWQRTVKRFGSRIGLLKGLAMLIRSEKYGVQGGAAVPVPQAIPAASLPTLLHWRASASYRPLRAVWAVCAWALRGSREITRPLQRSRQQRTI